MIPQLKGWLFLGGILGLVGLGIWWLVQLNTSTGGEADSLKEEDKRGAITTGLIEGKDYGTDYTENEEAEFEVLIVIRDQQADNPEEDRRSSLKRGDVLAVRKRPHLWSDTEQKSYLVVAIKMTGKEANALLSPKKEGDQIVLARAQRIDLDQLGFTGNHVVTGQSFEKKIFDPDIIKTK